MCYVFFPYANTSVKALTFKGHAPFFLFLVLPKFVDRYHVNVCYAVSRFFEYSPSQARLSLLAGGVLALGNVAVVRKGFWFRFIPTLRKIILDSSTEISLSIPDVSFA